MARGTSLSPDTHLAGARARLAPSTRLVLMAVLLPILITVIVLSLLVVWHRNRQQVTVDFTAELRRSVQAFESAEDERFSTLQREAALLAELPSLKALLTTNDDPTIQNAALDFWKTSGNELFALAGADDHVRSVYAPRLQNDPRLAADLRDSLKDQGYGYLLSGGRLYRYAARRVYFGEEAQGTLLGVVVTGYEISSTYLADVRSGVDAETAFVSRNDLLASSATVVFRDAVTKLPLFPKENVISLTLGRERYLAMSDDLSSRANAPLQVIFYRSLRPAEMSIHDISRQLLALGVIVLIVGSLLVAFVAGQFTHPLEELARRVDAFGHGLEIPPVVPRGTREVQQLTVDFQSMQTRIEESNRARLESERLATIGSMASSVSHDLRHHLASIYANAEFLAAPDATEEDRSDLFQEIQFAVMATTEMLESLTIFSRTGQAARRAPEPMARLLESAAEQVRMHPAAARTHLDLYGLDLGSAVEVDGKQIERALFNLLLNACQSRRPAERLSAVTATIWQTEDKVCVCVTDNGNGVPSAVQATLFEPFVSAGKQNGTGLGLTLARRIAEDHEGQVVLESSTAQQTTFQLWLPLIPAVLHTRNGREEHVV